MDVKELKSSLKNKKDFFENFREDFYGFFEETVNRYSLSDEIKSRIKNLKDKIYDRLFISLKDNREDFYNLAYTLAKDDIDIREFLKASFVYTVKRFSEYLLKNRPSIKDLNFLTQLLNEYMTSVEKAYLDYERVREEAIISGSESDREKYEEEFILETLKDNIGKELTAVSYYKEIPIIFKVKLKKVTDKFIVLDISKTSINVSKLKKVIYLKADMFGEPVKAQISSVDYKRNILVLEKPRLSEIPAEKRKYVRVQLDEPIKIMVRKENEETMGLIVDISAGGIRFYTGNVDNLQKGDKINVFFELSGENVSAKGEIKHINKTGNGYMVGVQLLPDLKTENLISDFVMSKQFQILRELRI